MYCHKKDFKEKPAERNENKMKIRKKSNVVQDIVHDVLFGDDTHLCKKETIIK